MTDDHGALPAGPTSDPPTAPINNGMGVGQNLLLGVAALIIAALAVVLFSVIQTSVDCIYKPVTYSLFTGVVLAAVGSAFGGSAAVRANFPSIETKVAVTGGAAFLLVVLAAVWWVTRTSCSPGPDIKLSAIPGIYAISSSKPSVSAAYLRVRFTPEVSIREFVDPDVNYDVFFPSSGPRSLTIQVDLIQGNKSVDVCHIDVQPAPTKIVKDGSLTDGAKYLALEQSQGSERHSNGGFVLKFRSGFVEDVLTKYHFDKEYSGGGSNDCIQIDISDPSTGHVKPALVNEIYFTEPGLAERVKNIDIGSGDLSALRGGFRLYAVRAAQALNPVSDVRNEVPVPAHVETDKSPASPDASCQSSNGPSGAKAALDSLKQTGVASSDDVKTLFEHWCEVEKDFYDTLGGAATDATLRYRLVRFVRSSITAIDSCWASNDTYRLKYATKGSCVDQRLDRPRNLARPLPFVNKIEQKRIVIDLLHSDNAQVHHEVEVLLRLYPHDDFDGLLDKRFGAVHPADFGQTIAPAAVSFYYNRIVEQGWADGFDQVGRISTELAKGLKWAGNVAVADQAVARARLHYAAANAYVQIGDDKTPSEDITHQTRDNFSTLLNLSSDDKAAYPYPHHLARAFAYVRGGADQVRRFDTYKIDDFERVNPPRKITAETVNYDKNIWVLPDAKGMTTRPLAASEPVQILMTFAPNSDNTWQFVITASDVGWIRQKGKPS